MLGRLVCNSWASAVNTREARMRPMGLPRINTSTGDPWEDYERTGDPRMINGRPMDQAYNRNLT